MNKTADDMIESIEAVKGGHVTGMVVQGMDGHVEKLVMPFDSVPPSLVVVSREGLVKLLQEKDAEITQLKYEIAVLVKQPNPPLTFDQLKDRVGRPVWRKDRGLKGYWGILSDVRETHKMGMETARELKIVPHYVGEYMAYNPARTEYYDRETQEEK